MTDFVMVDPKGWQYDLHSVYSAYIGYFQTHNIPWYDRTWGHLFSSFEEFLAFSWPVITVTDAYTGRAHIVTRLTSIGAFLKMIKTRFGETLQQAPNILQITPFETSTRHLRNISDYPTYKKLYSTLPAAVLSAQRTRVRTGEIKSIKELWTRRDKTFLALSFVWSERNEKSLLEFGYAALRCGHMEASGHWPPIPDTNYRKGHYIVEEYVDKVTNKYPPNHPWQYAFDDSQLTPKAKLPQIIQAIISSLASPDSETSSNTVVLVGHGVQNQLARLEEMKIKIPHNVLMIDITNFERSLYAAGERGTLIDPKNDNPRTKGTALSLESLIESLFTPSSSSSSSANWSSSNSSPTPTTRHNSVPNGGKANGDCSPTPLPSNRQLPPPQCALSNAGNEAFMVLFALQMLLDPANTRVPIINNTKKGLGSRHYAPNQTIGVGASFPSNNLNMNMGYGGMSMMGPVPGMPMPGIMSGSPATMLQGLPMTIPYGMPAMVGVNGIPTMVQSSVPGIMQTQTSGSAHVTQNGGIGPVPTLSANHTGNGNGSENPSVNPSLKHQTHRRISTYDLSSEFSQMSMTRAHSTGPSGLGNHNRTNSNHHHHHYRGASGGGTTVSNLRHSGTHHHRSSSPFMDVERMKQRYNDFPSGAPPVPL